MNKNLKKNVGIAAVVIIALSACTEIFLPFLSSSLNPIELTDNSTVTAQLNDSQYKLKLEVAVSDVKKATGLMYRDSIPDGTGMFFVFQSLTPLNFWMKDTPSSLDIIYLDSNLKVVTIYSNTKPNQTEELYPSILPAEYVIETRAGWAQNVGLTTDSTFTLN